MNKRTEHKLKHLLDKEWEKLEEVEQFVQGFDRERNKAKLLNKLKNKKARVLSLSRVAAVVAILLLCASVYYVFSQESFSGNTIAATDHYIKKEAQPGVKKRILLPDGSVVNLNSGSFIQIPRDFGKVNRSVVLQGEAFFDVKRNESKPFIIASNGVETKVLGTSFNVSSYRGENTVVTVKSGKVKVALQDELKDQKVLLTRGKQAVYKIKSDVIEASDAPNSNSWAWKDGVLEFSNLTLKQAAVKIERWYGVSIIFGNQLVGQYVVYGSYKNEKLNNVLKSLSFIHDISYNYVDDERVVIN